MTSVTAIGVDNEENVSPTRPIVWIRTSLFATIVRSLQCASLKDAGGIFGAEASLVEAAPARCFVPLEEHRQMYAVSAVRPTMANPSSCHLLHRSDPLQLTG